MNLSEREQQNKMVLIVDSADSQRKGIALALRGHHFQVQEVSNPIDAIPLLRKRHFDIIISDIEFSLVDGIEALGLLHGLTPLSTILVMVPSDCSQIRKGLEQTGIHHFLEKPISLPKLHEGVMKCLAWGNHFKKNHQRHLKGPNP